MLNISLNSRRQSGSVLEHRCDKPIFRTRTSSFIQGTFIGNPGSWGNDMTKKTDGECDNIFIFKYSLITLWIKLDRIADMQRKDISMNYRGHISFRITKKGVKTNPNYYYAPIHCRPLQRRRFISQPSHPIQINLHPSQFYAHPNQTRVSEKQYFIKFDNNFKPQFEMHARTDNRETRLDLPNHPYDNKDKQL